MQADTALATTLAAMIVLAGCLGGTTNDGSVPDADPTPSESGVHHLEADQALVWNASLDGDVGIRFRLAPSEPTTCEVAFAYQDSTGPPGWNAFMVVEDDGGAGWVLYGNARHEVQVRAGGLVDSRPIVRPAGYDDINEIRWTAEAMTAPAWFTMAASGMSTRSGPGVAQANAALEVRCDLAATVGPWEAGREFILFESWKNDGGAAAGAEVPFVGGVNAAAADSFEADFKSTRVQVFIQEAYAAEGILDISHPDGIESYRLRSHPFDDAPFHAWNGTAGTYGVDSTEVGYFGDGYWGVLVGLQPVAGPAAIEGLSLGHAHPCPRFCA